MVRATSGASNGVRSVGSAPGGGSVVIGIGVVVNGPVVVPVNKPKGNSHAWDVAADGGICTGVGGSAGPAGCVPGGTVVCNGVMSIGELTLLAVVRMFNALGSTGGDTVDCSSGNHTF